MGRQMSSPLWPDTNKISNLLLAVFYSILATRSIKAEIRPYTGILDATPYFIHYTEGYVVAPGTVDLSPLVFYALDDGSHYDGKNRTDGGLARYGNKEAPARYDDDKTGNENGTGGGFRRDEGLGATGFGNDQGQGSNQNIAIQDDFMSGEDTIIDIVVFLQPPSCEKSQEGCDWTELGVGASDGQGNLRWCCWDDAIDLGLCKGTHADKGRLIINSTIYEGEHRAVAIPATGTHEMRVSNPQIEIPSGETGAYVLIMANCNGYGRRVELTGSYIWESAHGYLPGELFGEMYFYAFLVVAYTLLILWYGISMSCYKDDTIPIQKWILVTIFMGLLESFFKAGDLWVWNEDGVRFWFAMYVGIIVGVCKRAISRCLVLMVSLGWGVVRDTLEDQMQKIVALGIVYVGVALARDILAVIAVVDFQSISYDKEIQIIDVVSILTFAVAFVDVTFYMWILDALNGTMQYLENMNQNVKLLRYLRLRLILLLSIVFAIAWAVFGIVDQYVDESILETNQEWAVGGAWEINYIMVLTCVAVLWRPNASAKQYAFVMELPSVGGDVEFSTNDGVEEDDEEYEDHPATNGVDTANGEGKALKIDSAVHT